MATLAEAVGGLPARLNSLLRSLLASRDGDSPVETMLERAGEFTSPQAALIAGVNQDPALRDQVITEIADSPNITDYRVAPEIVVGGGIHAAIYCAARAALGKPRPIVITGDLGGVMGMSRKAAFFLNSRNRPGPLGNPGDRDASLNTYPGSFVQPSDLGWAEYQTNDVLGLINLLLLYAHADLVSGVVKSIEPQINIIQVTLTDGRTIPASRVVIATGLAPRPLPDTWAQPNGGSVMSYEQFMARMDSPFPMQGMKKVAVIGAGDAGKTVVEALTGQGPSCGMNVASLDYPNRIDWYGQPSDTKEEFERCNRSRYKPLGRLFPRGIGDEARVRPESRAAAVTESFSGAVVNSKPYDHVVYCTGYQPNLPELPNTRSLDVENTPGMRVGRRLGVEQVYTVGPCSELALSGREEGLYGNVGENVVAMFRYAERTATLAKYLN